MKVSEKKIIESLKEIGAIRKSKEKIPQKIFYTMCQELVTTTCEVIPVNEKGEIFLQKREQTDEFFPGLWHTAGSINLPNETIKDVLKRIIEVELGLKFNYKKIEFVGLLEINKGPGKNQNIREQARALVFVIRVNSSQFRESEKEIFLSIARTPKKSVTHHKNLLWPMVKKYLKDGVVRLSLAK